MSTKQQYLKKWRLNKRRARSYDLISKGVVIISGFVGDPVGDYRLISGIMNEIQHDAGGIVVCGWELGEELL